ncbi:alpha-2-macroglobulin family protein [Lutibaculum baratangense]|uniref:PAN domain protein n=1 Tax=Lutibaculum baratangense AMV1 TaxID=631454 RepID=V4RQY9_9HYPH|nr:alpha-2-macroglobulin family protein [Lutibaculum baratangense]ESR25560.1 PAN domain protein [Lutibaculum baratangense AMV1]
MSLMRVAGLLGAALAFAAPALAQGTAGGAAQVERRIVTVENGDYFGFDIGTLRDVELADCEQACLADQTCGAFTYNTRAKWCFLKSEAGELQSFAGAVAGRVVEEQAAAELPKPELGFLEDWIAQEARRAAAEIEATPMVPGTVAALRGDASDRMAAGNPQAAAAAYAQAIAKAPRDAGLWLDYAVAARTVQSNDYGTQIAFQNGALGAAVKTIETAGDMATRARGYAVLARALESRSNFRPALEAYKESLAANEDADVRQAYLELDQQHGFRIVDYTINSDAADPRVCVQFSEELRKGRTNFQPYVTLDGQPAQGLDASGQELCVTGVEHGERYRLTIRAGLPAEIGETLKQASDLDVYIRDRSPAVRFSASDFVLPRVGSKGIPVTSVNTEEVRLSLYRVPARSLSQVFGQGSFLNPLAGYSAETVADQTGEKLWDGRLDVRRELNREVVTAIPLDEALPEREPGVYVLTATAVGAAEDEWSDRATQWFVVTDTGLATLTGTEGLTVFARSLDTAEPLAGVELTLIARNNEVLGSATTDETGRARFDRGLVAGRGGMAPGHLTARGEAGDFVFLDLTRSGFDLSDRGVDGRAAPGTLDAFLYTDRGVYRPGETVHLGALLRDDQAQAVPDLPLTLVLSRPDGMENRRVTSREGEAGGRVVDLPLVASAMRGAWRVTAHAEPDGPAIAEIGFLVEDFVPDRLEFELSSRATMAAPGETVPLHVEGQFLYGAPAADLPLQGDVIVSPVRGMPSQPGFVFGLAEEEAQPVRETLSDLPRTDEDGTAGFEVALPDLPAATRPLEARFVIRMREGGGRGVERTLTLPVAPRGTLIGVRPQFSGDAVGAGATARFDAIAIGTGGDRTALPGAEWQLLKVERSFQHYRANGQWLVEPVTYTERVAGGTTDITAEGRPAPIEAPVESGRYRLEVRTADPAGPITSLDFTAGWYQASPDDESPDSLDVSLDRATYGQGDEARVTIEAPFDGRAVVSVIADRVIETREVAVSGGRAEISLPVTEAWAPGAYVTAMLFRPMSTADEQAARMPARAIGLSWVSLDMSARTLGVTLDAPDMAHPRGALEIGVTIDGIDAGEEAYLTLAAVDVGILNLTAFEPPAPVDHYYGQRALGTEIRDLYGSLIDGLVGESGRLRVGGGEPGGGLLASPPAQDPVALFSGLVTVGEDGRATVTFDVPQFNGTLRLMAVAWTADSVGEAAADVVVRDPVVVTATAPRVLAPGDASRLYLEIDNRDGPAGPYLLDVSTSEELSARPLGSGGQIELAEGQRTATSVEIAGVSSGVGEISVRLTNPEGLQIEQTLRLPVRPATGRVSERSLVELQPVETFRLDGTLLAGLDPGTASLSLSATGAGSLDVAGLMRDLQTFPYGCSEQIASQMFPALYLGSLAERLGVGYRETAPGMSMSRDEAIRTAIAGLVSNQSSTGGFGLWGPSSGDLWLDSYVSEFLTRAREEGFAVPDLALSQALDNLSNTLAYVNDASDGGAATAYALYVLALNQRAAISDLRYFVDAQLENFETPLAKAQLGAALSLYGESERAGRAFGAAYDDLAAQASAPAPEGISRNDYGSPLRDAAGLLTLAAASPGMSGEIGRASRLLEEERARRDRLSTQEQAWLLRAADALIEGAGAGIRLEIGGETMEGVVARSYAPADLQASPVAVRNLSDRPVTLAMTASGVPASPPDAASEGFSIERTTYAFDGTETDAGTVAQNERFVVVIRVTKNAEWPAHVLVEDRLPGGLEIDNPSLVSGADLASFSWLPETSPVHTEFRDDRFVAAFDTGAERGESFTVAYMVRAVAPGRYARPGAHVEDMYRPYLFGRTQPSTVEVLAPAP